MGAVKERTAESASMNPQNTPNEMQLHFPDLLHWRWEMLFRSRESFSFFSLCFRYGNKWQDESAEANKAWSVPSACPALTARGNRTKHFSCQWNNFSDLYVCVSQGYSCCVCSNPQGKIESIWHGGGLSLLMISSLRNEEQKLFSLYLGLLSHSCSFSCIFSPKSLS